MNRLDKILLNAAAVTTTQTSHEVSLEGCRGIRLFQHIGTLTGGGSLGLTTKVQVKDPTANIWQDLANAAFGTKTAAGDAMLTVYPGVTAATNIAVSMAMTGPFRVVATITDASNATFSVTAVLIP